MSTPAHSPRPRTPTTPWPTRPSSRSCSSAPSSAARSLELAGAPAARTTVDADRAGQRVAAEGASRARPGCSTPRTSAVGDDRRDRHDAAAERLAEHVHVGHDALVLAGEGRPGAAQAGLDLVGERTARCCVGADPAHARRGSRPAAPARPASPWIGSISTATVVVVDRGLAARPGRRRARSGSRACTARSRSRASGSVEKLTIVVVRPWKLPSATMIVAWSAGHALDLVAPLAGHLDRGLHRLGAGVHRQHQVLAAQLGELRGRTANWSCTNARLVSVTRSSWACAAAISAGWRWPKLSAE